MSPAFGLAVSTADVISSDAMTSYPVSSDALPESVFGRYPGSLLYEHFIPHAVRFNRYIIFVWLVVGLIGNGLSAMVWLERRMRRHNSSAVYIAALSVNCIVFLMFYLVNAVRFQFDVQLYNWPVVCQVFNTIYFVPQYLTQLLVLAFTVDRYIVVCYPLKRVIYCRPSRAVKVIVGLHVICMLSASVYAYIYTYDSEKDRCDARPQTTFITIYMWLTELTFNLVAPLATVVLNTLVIRALFISRRARSRQLINEPPGAGVAGKNQKSSSKTSTTLMMLSVSFFYVATTLPMTFVYISHPGFPPGNDVMTDQEVLSDVTWKRHFNYRQVEYIFSGLSLAHYACNFFIFIPTGRHFREALCDLLLCRGSKTTSGDDHPSRTHRNTLSTGLTDSPAQAVRQTGRPLYGVHI